MCGVAGILAYHYAANPVDRVELQRVRDHMLARGPDGAGTWIAEDGRIGLAHRRLSIIDLTDLGAQPMSSDDGNLVVTFNGEIYNHLDLRRGLEARGYAFRSRSDTEVLLHLYADKGEEMVHELRGMFAFAIWDVARRRLFLARDPFGIKPLYYADDGWTFRFASSVKAMLAGGAISRELDPAGRVGFYLFGSVPEPYTSWRAIRGLPAGTTLTVDHVGPTTPRRHHAIAEVYAEAAARGPATTVGRDTEVREALLDSVRAHLIADVPVGAFLSAGIDSGALVGLMRDAGADDLQTVTVAFEEYRGTAADEAPLAASVAGHYGTRHTTRIVTRAEFEADLPRIIEAMDQPSIDGVNAWFVAKAARELGLKVAVSGLGGDELLGGYPSFRDLPRWVRTFSLPGRVPFLGAAARSLAAPIAPRFGLNPKAAGMIELGGTWSGAYLLRRGLFMPWELPQVLDRDTIRAGLRRLAPLRQIDALLASCPRQSFARVATLEASNYMRNQLLRDTDWASMAHSLEVRVPLVDCHLLSRVAPYADQAFAADGKRLLATAPRRHLPTAILDRPKTGFTTPIDGWMKARAQDRPAAPHPGHRPVRAGSPWARDWSVLVRKLSEAAAC